MKKLFVMILVCCATMFAWAQFPIGTDVKPFFMLESDSIAAKRIAEVTPLLGLTDKQSDRMVVLFGQEFEEQCRNIQMSLMSSVMGNQESGIDTLSIKKVFDGISEKYTNRYSKILDANQLAKWTEMENSRKQTEFKNLLNRILATLKDLF